MEKRIFTLIFLVSFFSVFIGCSYLETHKNIETECIKNSNESLAIKLKFDSLVHNSAQTNPDSAIYYSLKLIHYFDSIGCQAMIFDSYFYLSEIYLHVKPNDFLATYYFSEGVKIMVKNNLDFAINPFFLIDIGNLLFRHRLYQQAIEKYRIAGSFAQKNGHNYAEAVACNNIGLCYQKINQYDSAAFSMRKGLALRKTLMPLLEAQNYLYLSKIFLEIKNPDSVFFYHSAATNSLKKQMFSPEKIVGMPLENAVSLADEIEIEKEFILAGYYELTEKSPHKAIIYYEKNLSVALQKQHMQPYTENSIKYASLLIKTNKLNKATEVLEASFMVCQKINNHGKALEISRMMAGVYSKMNQINKEKLWLQKCIQYSDSLIKMEFSNQLMDEKILLLTAQTEQELSNSRINLQKNKIIIKNQSISILVLALSVIAISTFLTIVAVQRRKLNAAYHALVERTMQIIDKEGLKNKAHDHPLADKQASALLHHLESLMLESQLYLDPEISMTNLAKHLGTNEKYLSMLFNHQLKTTFNDYINSLRIAEACRMMNKADKQNKSVEQIADASGFGSRSAFYTAFKKYTGVTPAFFMKSKMGKITG
jgi:AraC-like DNA-binding protein